MSTPRSVNDPFGARAALGPGLPDIYRLDAVADRIDLASLPVTVKILLENTLRHAGGGVVEAADVETLLAWRPGAAAEAEIPFMPARVLLQDFTGVPAVVDLAVMRDAMADLGGDPAKVNPLVPADLVIDHSVQIDRFGTPGAFAFNVEREYERNGERYQLLRWAQTAFRDLRVVPPGHRHRPPGQPRVPGDRGHGSGGWRRPAGRLPGHARRHRFAHDDGQRPGRPRLRRRRHRGRGRPARPAALPADAARRRCPPPWSAAARLDRDRPRPGRDRDAPRPRGRRGVRRVRRRWPGHARPRRPDDDQQHEPRVRGHRDPLPDRRRDDHLPAPDRPLTRAGRRWSSATRRPRDCGASPATGRRSTSSSSSTWRAWRRPSPGRAGRRTASRSRRCARTSARTSRTGWRPTWATSEARCRSPATASSRTPRPPRSRRRTRRRSSQPTRWTRSPRRRNPVDAAATPGGVRAYRAGRHRDRRPALRGPHRLGRHRGDHVVHQHLQPDRDGRGRSACPQRGRPRPARRADGQDLAGAGLARGHRLPRGGRADGAARGARVRPGRLRLHDLHRQLRAARRGGRRRRRGERPGRRRGPVREPQLRGPDPSAGTRELPRLAATRRRLRAGRPGRHRPDDRAARDGQRRAAGLPRRHLAGAGRDPLGHRRLPSTPSSSGGPTRRSSTATTRWRAAADPVGRPLRLGGRLDVHRKAAVLRGADPGAATRRRHRGRPGPGRSRRLGDDRPHLAGRLDRAARPPPASGSRRMASARSSSTRTARGAVTTR